MAIKPADRLLFIIALAALGITLIVGWGPGRNRFKTSPPAPRRLAVRVTENSGLTARDLEPMIAAYRQETGSDIIIDIDVAAADETAGILITESQLLAREIAEGRYQSLDQYLHSDSPLEEWVLPLVSSMDVLVYNIPVLRDAGFDRPPRTRSEFLRYAGAIKAGRYGLSLGLSPEDSRGIERDIFSWFWASGLRLLRDGKPALDGKDYTGVLEFFSQLNQEGLIAPGSFSATGARRIEEFAGGNIAAMIVSVRELRKIREKMDDDAIGITLVPQADDYPGKPVFGLSTWYAGIAADSPHPDEAWELLRFLREHSFLLAETLALVPGTGGSAAYIATDPLLDKAWDMYEAADTVQEFLGLRGAEELEDIFRRELEAMFRDARSPADTAAAIHRQWGQWKQPENL